VCPAGWSLLIACRSSSGGEHLNQARPGSTVDVARYARTVELPKWHAAIEAHHCHDAAAASDRCVGVRSVYFDASNMAPKQPPWKRKPPPGKTARTSLTAAEIKAARERAAAAGRRYPNLVDNMWALRQRSLRDR
jgi:hypothetical protein